MTSRLKREIKSPATPRNKSQGASSTGESPSLLSSKDFERLQGMLAHSEPLPETLKNASDLVVLQLRLTEHESAKLTRLGGMPWLTAQIEASSLSVEEFFGTPIFFGDLKREPIKRGTKRVRFTGSVPRSTREKLKLLGGAGWIRAVLKSVKA